MVDPALSVGDIPNRSAADSANSSASSSMSGLRKVGRQGVNLQHSTFKSNRSEISGVMPFRFPSMMDSEERAGFMKESLMSFRQSMLSGGVVGESMPGMSLDGEQFKLQSMGAIDFNKPSVFPSFSEISDLQFQKLSELHALVNATDAEGNKLPLPDNLSDEDLNLVAQFDKFVASRMPEYSEISDLKGFSVVRVVPKDQLPKDRGSSFLPVPESISPLR